MLTRSTSPCSAWLFDKSVFSGTAVEDFKMICSNSWRRTVAQSSCMAGMLAGSLVFGRLGDKLGRRPVLTLALALLVLAGLLPICFPSTPDLFLVFLTSRFLSGFGGIGTFLMALCLSLEYVSSTYRYLVGILIQVPFTFGGILVALVSWAGVRAWKDLLLLLTLPNLLLLCYWKVLPESPLWVTSCSSHQPNNTNRTVMVGNRQNQSLKDDQVMIYSVAEKEVEEDDIHYLSMFRSRRMVARSLTLLFNWVVVMLAYFGITMTANTFYMDNLFLNYILVFAADFPSHLFCILGIERLGRRLLFGGCQALAGLTFLVGSFLPGYYQVVLTLIGKFFVSAALSTMFVYTAELYPTRIRNTAVGTCSLVARIGGIISPQVVALQVYLPQLPFIIFGSLSLLGGVLIFLFLPETLGEKLPETLKEAEDIGRKDNKQSKKDENLNEKLINYSNKI